MVQLDVRQPLPQEGHRAFLLIILFLLLLLLLLILLLLLLFRISLAQGLVSVPALLTLLTYLSFFLSQGPQYYAELTLSGIFGLDCFYDTFEDVIVAAVRKGGSAARILRGSGSG